MEIKKIVLLFFSLNLCLFAFASEELETGLDQTSKIEMNQIIDQKMQENEVQKPDNQILHISQANINAEKQKFVAQENLNKKLKYAIMGGLWAAGSGVLVWLLFGSDNIQNFTKEQRDVLLAVIHDRAQAKEKEKSANSWYKNLYVDVKDSLSGLPKFVITSLIFGKVFEIINNTVNISFEMKDKIFARRNIGWFINHKTQFKKIAQEVNKLVENTKDQQMTNDELISLLSLFAIQLDRILGFIEYRTEEFARIKSTYVLMGKTVKDIIIDKTNQYFDSVNLALKENLDKSLVLTEFKDLLLLIVNKLNMFSTVETSAGFADEVSSEILDHIHEILSDSKDKKEQQAFDKLRSLFLGDELPNFGEEDEIS